MSDLASGTRAPRQSETPAEPEAVVPGTARDAVTSLQRAAGNRAASVYVQMRRGATRSTYDELVSASRGNFIGDVDEERCLSLVSRLSEAERRRAAQDSPLLDRLAGAFNAAEMIRLCDTLPLTLAQKVYWCWKAGEVERIDGVTLRRWFGAASDAHVRDMLGRGPLMELVYRRLDLPPGRLIGRTFPGPQIHHAYATYLSVARWLSNATSEMVFTEIARTSASDVHVQAARQRLVDIDKWQSVVRGLGGPTRMTREVRDAVRRVAQLAPADAAALFEKRFNHPLSSGDATFTHADIMRVWEQLDVLPDADVSQNTVIRSFRAITGDRGFWSAGHVELGVGLRTSSMGPNRLPHTVRHEIGHAVHDRLQGVVNDWLRQGVRFWYYDSGGRSGVRQVIADLGGWPATYTDMSNNAVRFTAADRRIVEDMLAAHVDIRESWAAATALPVVGSVARSGGTPTAAQKRVLLWEAMDARIRRCFANSTPDWYQRYATHPVGSKGFTFWNHWYSKPYYFSATALTAINATGDDYSAMSEAEFFANCYAEYFEDPAGATDPTRWGGSLNADVQDFFRQHIVLRQPYRYVSGAGAGSSVPRSPRSVPRS